MRVSSLQCQSKISTMKSLILVCLLPFVLLVGAGEDLKQKFQRFRQECVEETGVVPAEAEGLKRGKFTENDKVKQFIFCVNKKVGYQNADGDFQTDVLTSVLTKHNKLSPEVVEEIKTKCVKKLDTPQESAYQALKCAYGVSPWE